MTATEPRAYVGLVLKTYIFVEKAQRGLVRKGDGESLTHHAVRVAGTVATCGGDPLAIAGGIAHDVVEDTNVTVSRIRSEFGDELAELVACLTDPKEWADLPFITRKRAQAKRAAASSQRAQLIKLADQTENVESLLRVMPHWDSLQCLEYCRGAAVVAYSCQGASTSLWERFLVAHDDVMEKHAVAAPI